MTTNHLLVENETSKTKELLLNLVNSFKEFENSFGIDCCAIIREIEKHGLYITNGRLYFKYNAKLSFLRPKRAKKADVLKLLDFYETFDMDKTSFWTITKRTFKLSSPIFNINQKGTKINFPEVIKTEDNLKALIKRLDRYGYHIKKYIMVVEVKEKNDLFNYHYHGIFQVSVNIQKIRSIKNKKYRELVYHPEIKRDLDNGYIYYPLLSSIWKEITQDDSYRIERGEIKSKKGAFYYILSYMNKGIQYQNIAAVPYLYFIMKSKKAFRTKGLRKIPKIEYKILDHNRNPVEFNYFNTRWVEEQEIDIDTQEYTLQTYRNKLLVEEKNIIQYFKYGKNKSYNGNQMLSNFDRKLLKNKTIFTKKFNWREVERLFSPKEIQTMLKEGSIFETNEGYKLI